MEFTERQRAEIRALIENTNQMYKLDVKARNAATANLDAEVRRVLAEMGLTPEIVKKLIGLL